MKSQPSILRDFTVDRRVWLLSAVALVVGAGAAGLAVALLRCIALATNFFYYHRISSQTVSPAGSPLGLAMPFVPVVGGLIVGFMARYGSDKIRGHGIPEAIEAILLGGARVEPRIAILKPVSAAIAIGSGGPFGAEGPIIMTGGAFGSLIAQWMKLSDAERTTLLVAGAAAGMSATFAAPLAATLLAVELLLFELRPRSLVPVAVASAVAAVLRVYWLGPGPLFATTAGSAIQSGLSSIAAVGIGLFIGLASALLSRMMYGFEDLFGHLPLHWMWWPAIGGVGIGIGGIFFPRGLGVGYDNIAEILRGNAPADSAGRLDRCEVGDVGVFPWLRNLRRSACSVIDDRWSAGRDSGGLLPRAGGNSGPLGIAGDGRDAFRRARSSFDRHRLQSGTYPLPARVAAVDARLHRGACRHIADHAAIDSYGEIEPPRLSPDERVRRGPAGDGERDGSDVGIVHGASGGSGQAQTRQPHETELPEVFAFADETCRGVAETMATTGVSAMPVVDRSTKVICGQVTLQDLLAGRRRSMRREQDRVRVFGLSR